MKRILGSAVLTLVFFVSATGSADAQTTDTFMLVPGIEGESADARHQNWIDVLSLSQSFTTDKKGGSACGVSLSKRLDKAGPPLWGAAVTGRVFDEIRIEVIRAGITPLKVYEVILTNATVTSITSTPTELSEHLTLVGSSATLRYYPQRPDGSVGPPVVSNITCS
jgi:type VI secretion system secreted protein Hcp